MYSLADPIILILNLQDGYVQREFSMRENTLLQPESKPGFYTGDYVIYNTYPYPAIT